MTISAKLQSRIIHRRGAFSSFLSHEERNQSLDDVSMGSFSKLPSSSTIHDPQAKHADGNQYYDNTPKTISRRYHRRPAICSPSASSNLKKSKQTMTSVNDPYKQKKKNLSKITRPLNTHILFHPNGEPIVQNEGNKFLSKVILYFYMKKYKNSCSSSTHRRLLRNMVFDDLVSRGFKFYRESHHGCEYYYPLGDWEALREIKKEFGRQLVVTRDVESWEGIDTDFHCF